MFGQVTKGGDLVFFVAADGIPLIYLSDEIGTINDYTYYDDADPRQPALIFASFLESPQIILSPIFEQYSVHTIKHLHGVSKISLQSDATLAP